ncbi:hypothetical protein M3J09_007871 [Ascochyta lentis]
MPDHPSAATNVDSSPPTQAPRDVRYAYLALRNAVFCWKKRALSSLGALGWSWTVLFTRVGAQCDQWGSTMLVKGWLRVRCTKTSEVIVGM